MYVNNETGIIQDIHRIASICADQRIAFFTDATQAVAHIPTDYRDDAISLACFSAHKFGGPKGIGALVVKKGITIAPQIHGGGQENGIRSGTYNTPLIVGFGEACAQSIRLDFTSILENRNQLIRFFKENHQALPLFSSRAASTPHYLL